jgi:rRNA-processing protein FCF1
MNCILDTCSLICLSKIESLDSIFLLFSNLYITNIILDEFLISDKPRVEYKYLNIFFKKNKSKIKIITLENNKEFKKIKDYIGGSGESSIFYFLKKKANNKYKNIISITSDKKAYNKLKKNNIKVIKTYELYKLLYFKKKISKKQYIFILKSLLKVGGITNKEYLYERKLLSKAK